MEHLGIWGIIPPVIIIVLAFITKDVIISLITGILVGALFIARGDVILAILGLTDAIADNLVDAWNIRILLFCALLGGLVGLLTKTGASKAFGQWAATKIKGKRNSLLIAWFLGVIIFIDDYFNSLAVGTVMKPITDKNKISHAKLAWILDSTAAPVCIIAPISSWAVTIMSNLKNSEGFESLGVTPFQFFIHLIPFNLYAILTLLMILFIIFTNKDWGPMLKAEKMAENGILFDTSYGDAPGNIEDEEKVSRRVAPINRKMVNEPVCESRAHMFDMILPLAVLIITCIVMFPCTTYFQATSAGDFASFTAAAKGMSLADAFNNTDASVALFYSIIITLLITYIYYIARRLFTISSASSALMDGMKTMMPALVILTLAWTIGGIIKNTPEDGGMGLSIYLSEIFKNSSFPLALLPFIVFVLSAFIAFSTGTSWGTFAIMIPICLPITIGLCESRGVQGAELLKICSFCISAVLGGGVFGDHASPTSDTTILSSTGASCPHLQHLVTQLPYAGSIAVVSALSYLIGGVCRFSIFAIWTCAIILFALSMFFLPKVWKEDFEIKRIFPKK